MLYVTDPQSDSGCSQQPRVLKFDSDRKFIRKLGGSFGEGDGQFQDPEHLAIDSECNICVSNRIIKETIFRNLHQSLTIF